MRFLRAAHRRHECGATAVEMSLVLIVAFMIIALLVDAGMIIHNHGLMTDASGSLSRVIAATFNRRTAESSDCYQLACTARAAVDKWRNQHGYADDFAFTAWASPSNARYAPYPTLRIEATWKNNCIFCSFVPGGLSWTARSLHVVEYDTTYCTGGGERTC